MVNIKQMQMYKDISNFPSLGYKLVLLKENNDF